MFAKKNIKFVIGLLMIISSPIYTFASHLIGGKITYRYLGLNKYEIKLTVYRDCSDNIDFDNPAHISIFDKATNLLIYNKALLLNDRSIVPANPQNPCFVPPPGICVEIGNYIDTLLLNTNQSGYTIAYQRCCRNISVANIINPSFNGITITTDIPPLANNTPQFINYPPIYICVNDTFNYSFASTDIDGDNLVYQLCSPLLGGGIGNISPNPASPPPYQPVNWSNGYSLTNPIPNSGGISFNSTNGHIKFKPTFIGQFEIGIAVLEYRNNILINTNRLELQFNIVSCFLTSSIPTASNLCEGLTIPFQNSSSNANAFHWDFGVPNIQSDTSNLHSPTYTFPNYGIYTVSLVAFNSAYGVCKDTAKKIINVNPLLSPTLQPSYSSCFKNNNLNFNVGGSYHPSAIFNWNLTSNGLITNNNNSSINVHFDTAKVYHIAVIADQFGCKDTLNATVTFTNPIAKVEDYNLNCNERNLIFPNSSSGANSFSWNFGDLNTTSDTSTQISPHYNYSNYGNYTYTLIAVNGICSDTTTNTIHVFPLLKLNWLNTIQKQCLKNNSFNFSPTGIWGNNATFNWLFYNQPNTISSTQQNPLNIHFTNAGNHLIKYEVSENGCKKMAQAVAIVYPNPTAKTILSDTSGCEPITIKFKSITDSLHPVKNYWNINDSNYNDTTVYHIFINAGLYSYSIVVKDTNNCTDTISKTKFLKVNPTPKAKSFVNPMYSSILDPKITFIDSTIISHNTNYNFGDGTNSTSSINYHSFQSAGEFPYVLIVSNSFGCADTSAGIIIIDDIGSNYVPNIFSPNRDGVNDTFSIAGENITSSSMQIFNRWGTLIFNSKNALIGWNGINENNNILADDGTYFYIIKITLGNNRTYKFNGNVQLVK